MAHARSSPSLRHPERIHPALWRGSQLARPCHATTSTGHPELDQALPGQGWPVGALIELFPSRTGIGELSLLRPCLAGLSCQRSIFLVAPPYPPHFHCWFNWGLEQHRLHWISPRSPSDTLWAVEQILRHNASAALLCWTNSLRTSTLRRLHLAARQSESLFFMMRPPSEAEHASAAPLRLLVRPSLQGVDIHILKRKGPACEQPIRLALYPTRSVRIAPAPYHAALDQSLSAYA
ncbi:translesion DNA synthesis-associated protein ImuA [Allopusillimonas ginsengisoli]|uniref:translesion DNA synthesis-associated protein ImuA n=1 Tax=Allopusillimonas ginsengisoli TaxID=453575 RepID=UPI0010225D17|nr:translesion DNA synthesis-associated protein ImuA [Allopusillimonas ginsengisoli]TEA71868.1 translesion DNA synthesis-associated protein ImuA [Allopusillimonas ginsengisoli]